MVGFRSRACFLAFSLCACDASVEGTSGDAGGRTRPDASGLSDGGQDAAAWTGPEQDDPLYACATLEGEGPQTMAEAIERLNGLPEPASLECFLAGLPRPLQLVATTSELSQQPADGPDNPRIFLMGEGLVLSVVPGGPAASLLELSEWVSDTRTLKGELAFPLERPLAPEAPFERLDIGQRITSCGFCHREEEPHGELEGAFSSIAFQLQPGTEVSLEQLRALRAPCGDARDGDAPGRCDMLRALLDYGPVEQGAFPEGLAVFLESAF